MQTLNSLALLKQIFLPRHLWTLGVAGLLGVFICSDLSPVSIPLSQFKDTRSLSERVFSHEHSLWLKDQDKRVSALFKVKEPMRDLVGFWFFVYTKLTSDQVVLYHRDRPTEIYEILDYGPLRQSSRNAVVYEILRERDLKKKLAYYRNVNVRVQTGQRDYVEAAIKRSRPFLASIKNIFKELEVPEELIAISFVESSFNPKAHSRSGARGVWQFMQSSGAEFLWIDKRDGIDERLSTLKSSVAAARLLLRNLAIAGSWPLAVTAYHHGYRGFNKLSAQDLSDTESGEFFSASHPAGRKTLGYASRNYFAEFVAMVHVLAYSNEIFSEGFHKDSLVTSGDFFRSKRVTTGIGLARSLGVSFKELNSVNPDILSSKSRIPAGFVYQGLGGTQDLRAEELAKALIRVIRWQPSHRRNERRYAKNFGVFNEG